MQAQLQPGDLAGRVSAHGIALLFERGNPRDQEAWLGLVLQRIAAHAIQSGGAALKTHLQHRRRDDARRHGEPLARPMRTAVEGQREAAKAGGNRVAHRETARLRRSRRSPKRIAPGPHRSSRR